MHVTDLPNFRVLLLPAIGPRFIETGSLNLEAVEVENAEKAARMPLMRFAPGLRFACESAFDILREYLAVEVPGVTGYRASPTLPSARGEEST